MALDMAMEGHEITEERAAEEPKQEAADREKLEQNIERFQGIQNESLRGELLSLAETVKNTYRLEHDKSALENFILKINSGISFALEKKAGRLKIPASISNSWLGEKLGLKSRDITWGDLSSALLGTAIAVYSSSKAKAAFYSATGIGGALASGIVGGVLGSARGALRESISFDKNALSAESWQAQIDQIKDPAGQLRAIELLIKDPKYKDKFKGNASEAIELILRYEQVAASVEEQELERFLENKDKNRGRDKLFNYLESVGEQKRRAIWQAIGKGALRGAIFGVAGYEAFKAFEWIADQPGFSAHAEAAPSSTEHIWHTGENGTGELNIDDKGCFVGQSVVHVDTPDLYHDYPADTPGATADEVAHQSVKAMADKGLINYSEQGLVESKLSEIIKHSHSEQLAEGRFEPNTTVAIDASDLNQALRESGIALNSEVVASLPLVAETPPTVPAPPAEAQPPVDQPSAEPVPSPDSSTQTAPSAEQQPPVSEPPSGSEPSAPLAQPAAPDSELEPKATDLSPNSASWFEQNKNVLKNTGLGLSAGLLIFYGALKLRNRSERKFAEKQQERLEKINRLLSEPYTQKDPGKIGNNLAALSEYAQALTGSEKERVLKKIESEIHPALIKSLKSFEFSEHFKKRLEESGASTLESDWVFDESAEGFYVKDDTAYLQMKCAERKVGIPIKSLEVWLIIPQAETAETSKSEKEAVEFITKGRDALQNGKEKEALQAIRELTDILHDDALTVPLKVDGKFDGRLVKIRRTWLKLRFTDPLKTYQFVVETPSGQEQMSVDDFFARTSDWGVPHTEPSPMPKPTETELEAPYYDTETEPESEPVPAPEPEPPTPAVDDSFPRFIDDLLRGEESEERASPEPEPEPIPEPEPHPEPVPQPSPEPQSETNSSDENTQKLSEEFLAISALPTLHNLKEPNEHEQAEIQRLEKLIAEKKPRMQVLPALRDQFRPAWAELGINIDEPFEIVKFTREEFTIEQHSNQLHINAFTPREILSDEMFEIASSNTADLEKRPDSGNKFGFEISPGPADNPASLARTLIPQGKQLLSIRDDKKEATLWFADLSRTGIGKEKLDWTLVSRDLGAIEKGENICLMRDDPDFNKTTPSEEALLMRARQDAREATKRSNLELQECLENEDPQEFIDAVKEEGYNVIGVYIMGIDPATLERKAIIADPAELAPGLFAILEQKPSHSVM